MRNIRLIMVAAMLGLLAASCGSYTPSCTDIPLIQHRGQLQLEGAVVPTGRNCDLDMRGSLAWGVTDHFATEVSINPVKRYSQVMGGFYNTVGEKFVYEIYGGAAMGYGYVTYDDDPDRFKKGNYQIAFVQGDCGWVNLTQFLNLDLAFSLKTGIIHGDFFCHDGWEQLESGGRSQLCHKEKGNNFLLEPTMEVRFGWERLKFNIKAGFSFIPPTPSFRMTYFPFSIGVGVSYRFN